MLFSTQLFFITGKTIYIYVSWASLVLVRIDWYSVTNRCSRRPIHSKLCFCWCGLRFPVLLHFCDWERLVYFVSFINGELWWYVRLCGGIYFDPFIKGKDFSEKFSSISSSRCSGVYYFEIDFSFYLVERKSFSVICKSLERFLSVLCTRIWM